MSKPIVIALGEILWDMLPTGKRAGGAPVNFAYHASQNGAESYAISAVGNDELGAELLNDAPEILHELQRIQNVRCISAKSGQLKDQHIRNIIFAVLDVIQHPLKLLPPLNVLSGKALVRILPGNDHILVCRILPQLVTLGIQAVSVNLHRGGHSCIKIAFKLFLFQNLHLPHSFLLP